MNIGRRAQILYGGLFGGIVAYALSLVAGSRMWAYVAVSLVFSVIAFLVYAHDVKGKVFLATLFATVAVLSALRPVEPKLRDGFRQIFGDIGELKLGGKIFILGLNALGFILAVLPFLAVAFALL